MIMIDFIATLSDEDCYQCIKDYEILERDGSIDECKLREVTREYAKVINDPVTIKWMDIVAIACYRRFASHHIQSMGWN